MNLVFLDENTINWHDGINFSPIKSIGVYRGFAQTFPEDLLKHAKQANVVITNKVRLDSEKIFTALPKLKLICVAATGVNNINLDLARKHEVAVCNVPEYCADDVAEHTFMLMLASSRRFAEQQDAARSGAWSSSSVFCLPSFPFDNLNGKSLGILGYGNIGKRVAKLAKSFGMTVRVAALPGRRYPKNAPRTPLNELLALSDFITLHCPLTPKTQNLFGFQEFRLMKKSAFLINASRGALVDELALVAALKKSQIAGYAADVLSAEPPKTKHPFFHKSLSPKVILTPHIAWASKTSRQKLVNEIAKNIRAFQNGRSRNRVV